ncbi:hypothetical protein VTO42DRAFT_6646 [Malbranchea cinnamomea]
MNMATIKAIDARSIHQIQSGQVIVDLCSVVKELVENSLDAHATSIDVRFKNNGLDLIEVQDNGDGISPNNYEVVALKHYTSKLSTFDDLTSLQTFGFRGEALSSLCALSDFHIVTAQADQVPKASRLDFEASGKLKSTQVVAGQKGTTACVENLFHRLPVRRRELEKNIKREYGKVLGLLHAYACVSTGVRFSVKNQMPKGKSVMVFSTKSNATTRENISNIYGAKTLLALIPLELKLEFEPSAAAKKFGSQNDQSTKKIFVHGHISKPVFGEGRQTPDRQMFFVNSRPCGLPQIAKAFNEVYKSFNVSQSPFIFANFEMDTASYDVNVSPDKRTILIHDAAAMIESLKVSLTELFENQEQTVPQSQLFTQKQSSMKQTFGGQTGVSSISIETRHEPVESSSNVPRDAGEKERLGRDEEAQSSRRSIQSVLGINGSHKESPEPQIRECQEATPHAQHHGNDPESSAPQDQFAPAHEPAARYMAPDESGQASPPPSQTPIPFVHNVPVPKTSGIVPNAFDRMRPRRTPPEIATITIGDKTVKSTVGGTKRSLDMAGLRQTASRPKRRIHTASAKNRLTQSIRSFAAPGTQPGRVFVEEEVDEESSEAESQEYESDIEPEERVSEKEVADDDQEMSGAEQDERGSDSDGNYVDDEEQKAREQTRVRELIRAAEEAAEPSKQNNERAKKDLKRSRDKDSTVDLMCSIDGSIAWIEAQMETLRHRLLDFTQDSHQLNTDDDFSTDQDSAETKLSLTVSKDDFAKMRIVGQFNLGFILATRSDSTSDGTQIPKDELFIIDQHASDEKYNFERLQAETVVQNQRLVQPKTLDLTAVEEEIIIDNLPALEKNGFIVHVDTSGDEPIGRRCKLLSLPLSKEVVFTTRDLEELIVLLSEAPHSAASSNMLSNDRYTPRPSKVRKMFAMRACRSSIMIGKPLTLKQMEKVVRHMGMIDKPWNCPHGRPTMRHLMSLGQWKEWDEWDHPQGKFDTVETNGERGSTGLDIWK